MIDIYFKTIRDEEFQLIKEFRVGSWINVYDATSDDLLKIANLTKLDISDLQDSLDKYETPRIENREGNILIFCRHPSAQEVGLYTMTLTIILTNNFIITISPLRCHLIEAMIKHKLKIGTTQKSKLLFYTLLRITHEFSSKIKAERYSVIEQERAIKDITNDAISELTRHEDILNQYLATLVPMKNLLEAITTGRFVSLYEKDHDLLQDLLIAIKQSEDLCKINVKSIHTLRESYQIIFTNNVNKTIRFLTAITIIFTIPTMIASIYGMNIPLPFGSSRHAFITLLAIIFVSLGISLFIFTRKKWL